jgi:hypothetical protein
LWLSQGKKNATSNLCEKDARDTLGDTEQRLRGILLSLTDGFSEIPRVREDCSAMLRRGVQLGLLRKRFVGHGES